MTTTLGGFRPGSAYHVIPTRHQLWWKPCLRRVPDGTDTHCWYLSPTSDGSMLCWSCRVGAPRVVVASAELVAEIREALDAGDLQEAHRLAFGTPAHTAPDVDRDIKPANKPFAPRDIDDWTEFFKERAAMFEFLGGAERAAAEAMARELAGEPPQHGRRSGPLFAGAR